VAVGISPSADPGSASRFPIAPIGGVVPDGPGEAPAVGFEALPDGATVLIGVREFPVVSFGAVPGPAGVDTIVAP
jgi:hypothetical protein